MITDKDEMLIEFMKKFDEETKNGEKKLLKDHLVYELLRQLVSGDREISALATSENTGDVFVCFSFKEKKDIVE